MEGDVITTQELFTYQYQGENADGKLRGVFKPSGIRPAFLPRAEYFGLDRPCSRSSEPCPATTHGRL